MATIRRPVRRAQIWWVDWNPARGSEQAGRRPTLIVQTDAANEQDEYNLVIVTPISGGGHADVPTHIAIRASQANGLEKDGFVRCEQILTITRDRLDGYIGFLEPAYMKRVGEALRAVLDLD